MSLLQLVMESGQAGSSQSHAARDAEEVGCVPSYIAAFLDVHDLQLCI